MKRWFMTLIIFLAIFETVSAAPQFRFVARTGGEIVDHSSDPIVSFGHWVSMNDEGKVAFKAKLQSGTELIVRADPNSLGLYNMADPSHTIVVDTVDGTVISLGDYVGINSRGNVSFRRKFSSGGGSFSIRRDSDRIAFATRDDPFNWYFRSLLSPTDISSGGYGMVSFQGTVYEGIKTYTQIRKGDSKISNKEATKNDSILIATETMPTQAGFARLNQFTSINDDGYVVFTGIHPTFGDGIFIGKGVDYQTPGEFEVVATTISGFQAVGQKPSINKDNRIGFYANGSREGIFIWNDGTARLRAGIQDPVLNIDPASRIAINDQCDIAFMGTSNSSLGNFRSLFRNSGCGSEIMVYVGQEIDGYASIDTIELWDGLNNDGQVACWVHHSDSTESIIVSDKVNNHLGCICACPPSNIEEYHSESKKSPMLSEEVIIPPSCNCSCRTNVDRLPQGRYTPNSEASPWADCGLGRPRCWWDFETMADWLKFVLDTDNGETVGYIFYPCPSVPSLKDKCEAIVNNQYKLRYKGCVLTSVTMIANSLLDLHGVEALIPSQVNAWDIFDNTPTYKPNTISNWNFVAKAINKHAGVHYFTHPPRVDISLPKTTYQQGLEKIGEIICNYKVPVAVRVKGRHTVVAYAVEYTSSGIKILIADPGKGNYPSLNYYPILNYIDYIVPCWSRPTYMNVSQCALASPAEMIITDSQGRKVGYDPRNGQTYSEIPDASYVVDWESEDTESGDPNLYIPGDRNEASKIVTIYSLPGETYSVEIIGTGEGSGLFTQTNMSPDAAPQLAVERSLSLSSGSIESLTIKSPEPGDLDLDGDIDAEDLRRFAGYWLQSEENLAADIYPHGGGDGVVNLHDFAEFAQHWMTP
jgi:hypothetical protein